MINIALTGGGTAGHVYPGLAVLERLKKELDTAGKKGNFFWLGRAGSLEEKIMSDAGIAFYGLPSGKLRRYFSWQNLIDPFKVIAGFFKALSILRRQKPALLFSKGGFVAVPPALAAWCLRVPIVTHESDISPGLATRLVSRLAGRVCLANEAGRTYFSPGLQKRLVVTGNPIRQKINSGQADRAYALLGIRQSKPLVLALGGSQGAGQINRLIEDLSPLLREKCCLVHQTGPTGKSTSRPPDYFAFSYLKDELADFLAAADLVVSRAGSATLFELAACGKPALLVPLSAGSRGEQIENARLFTEAGAAEIAAADQGAVFEQIDRLLNTRECLRAMRKAMLSLAQPLAAAKIATVLIERLDKQK